MHRLALFLVLLVSGLRLHAYDPLAAGAAGTTAEFVVRDSKRDRELPILVYLPVSTKPAPVILFSHGLGGSRTMGSYLGKHWSARGYVVVFLQHPGSDESVWRDAKPGDRFALLKGAGNLRTFADRVGDVPAVLDQLTAWQRESGHPLAGRLDLTRVGMSGHSFGAITTQAVSGQTLPTGGARFTDSRIRAALPMSQSPPTRGTPAEAFGNVKIPWMLMTGTRDDARIAENLTPENRAKVFPALPPGGKYELVLHEAQHSAFTDRPLPGETRKPNHHRSILALSTAFWDAYLKEDAAAKSWLDGSGPRTVLDPQDGWQRK